MIATVLENEAWTALEQVYDPCSVATRTPLNIVEMGLVREVEVDEDSNVKVSICPTSPSCMLMGSITEGAEEQLRQIAGSGKVEVKIDADFFWTPDAMTDGGKEQLAVHRAARADEAPTPLGRLTRRM